MLGVALVRSQLVGGLRSMALAGVFISACGGLLATIGRFLVLQSIVHGVRYGTRREVLRDAFLFALVSLLEGFCAVVSRQILAANVAHVLVARVSACLARKVDALSAADDGGAPPMDAIFGADIPRVLSLVKFLTMLPCGVAALLGGVGVLVYFLGATSLAGQETGDATSLRRGSVRSDAREKSIHALISPREMIVRPKLSQNDWELSEIGGFRKVGDCLTLVPCPGRSSASVA